MRILTMKNVSGMEHFVRVWNTPLLCAALLFGWCLTLNAAEATESDGRWFQIKTSLFGDGYIRSGEAIIGLETPERAMDAA